MFSVTVYVLYESTAGKATIMYGKDPYGDMTQQFLELWQKQWGSVMSDKQFIRAMLDMLQTVQQGAYGTGKPSHSHPAAQPDDDERVAELTARLAECEDRIAALEAAAKPGKRPAAKPAASRRRSRK